jgi:hypothetical protein
MQYEEVRLGDYDDFEGLGGISLRGITKGIKRIASPVQHLAANVGHAVGSAVTSKIGQGVLGVGLALTGVGAPAAAGIFAATKGVGNLIKPGGNLKHFATGAAQGAVEGLVSAKAGQATRALVNKIRNRGAASTALDVSNVAKMRPGLIPSLLPTPGIQADAASIAQMNAQDAHVAATVAGGQVGDILGQLGSAQASGNDALVAQLREQLAQAQQQADYAAQMAQKAQQASQAIQAGPVDPGQLGALVNAGAGASQAAQIAAAAPPTPYGTSQAALAAQTAGDAVDDAAAGNPEPEQASILGAHPVLLLAGVAAIALMTKKGRPSRRSR